MKLTLNDIPEESRTREYIISTYGVSKISAWRLLSGKTDHICPGYHKVNVIIAPNAWEVIMQYEFMRYVRNNIAYQIKKWGKSPSAHIDDIAQECYINAYRKSGIWMEMPESKKMAYIATLARRTTNDCLKRHVRYTDTCKNNTIKTDKMMYPCAD